MPDIDNVLRHGIPIVAGVVLLGGAAWVHQRDQFEAKNWVEQRATIVNEIPSTQAEEWAPEVEFEVNGQRFRHTGSATPSHVSIGNPVTIRFDPRDPPGTVRILQPLEGLVVPAVGALGLGALLAGVIGALRSRKR